MHLFFVHTQISNIDLNSGISFTCLGIMPANLRKYLCKALVHQNIECF